MLTLARVNAGDLVRVWLRNYDVYVRLWKTEVLAPLLEPLFSIIGFGWGVGSLVAGRVMEVPYLTFVGAGLLAFTALVRALFECTYGSYFRMVYQSTFDAILSTPVEVESLAAGEIVWGASKAFLDGLFVLAVLACFGAVLSPLGLLIPFVIGLGALWMAAMSLWVTARIHDINQYNFYMAFVFSYLWISGAYCPLDRLHVIVQVFAHLVPVTGAINISRHLMVGRLEWSDAIDGAYLVVATVVTTEMALRALRRRLFA